MPAPTEQLEREAAETRAQLAETLDALRCRMTPGSHGPPAEFLRNRAGSSQNPMPVVLIGIGIAWLMIASSRSSRALIASTADVGQRKTTDLGAAATAVVGKTSKWSKETGTLVERVSETTAQCDPRARGGSMS